MNTALRDRALHLLSYRAHSRRELHDKLRRKTACDEDELSEVLDWLEEMRFLDDLSFAQAVVRKYTRKGYEPWRIRGELMKRGISREIREAAMEDSD